MADWVNYSLDPSHTKRTRDETGYWDAPLEKTSKDDLLLSATERRKNPFSSFFEWKKTKGG